VDVPVYVRRDGLDPDPRLAELRAARPVSRITMPWGQQAWLVTRYADVRAVLGDAGGFGNGSRQGFAGRPDFQRAGFLVGYDPPEHTALRRELAGEFTVRRMRELAPRIARLAEDLLDDMAAAGPPADLVAAYALPLPSLVICELLGVPYQDRRRFQENSAARLDLALGMADRSAAVARSKAHIDSLIDRPGDGLLARLAARLPRPTAVGVADLLLLAGHETTASMLGLGSLLLLRNPAERARVRDGEPYTEEMLRYLSIVHSVLPREAKRDVTLSGRRIRAGDVVLCSIPAANRDAALVERPDAYDGTRPAVGHLAFGYGIHYCLGASLARVELQTALPALFRRFPGLALADDPRFRVSSAVYGLHSLPVTW
jgi:cytochrome P450